MGRRSRYPNTSFKPFVGHAGESGEELFGNTVSTNADIRYDGVRFKIKVARASFQLGTDLLDATGEYTGNLTGNAIQDTSMKTLQQLRGRVSFEGTTADSNAIGLANLENSANAVCDIKFMLGIGSAGSSGPTKNYLKFRLAVESMQIAWDYTAPVIGLSISGQITDEFAGSTLNAPIVETTS